MPQPLSSLTFPLTDAQQTAYQKLYEKLESAIEATAIAPLLDQLMDSRDDVNDVLQKNEQSRFETGTISFAVAGEEMKNTNAGLAKLKDQINAVADHINMAAEIVAAIDKVLTLVPSV